MKKTQKIAHQSNENPWPELPYEDFKSTSHLLHMITQIIGKLKLNSPFESEWAHVVLYVTTRGLTTGIIPYGAGAYSVDIDLIRHQITFNTSWMMSNSFVLQTMSVAQAYKKIMNSLHSMGIAVNINPRPTEVPHPIPFHEDTEQRDYNPLLANGWWRILMSSYIVFQRYHALFTGKTQPLGFMWGTFDLRDVRYNGKRLPIEKSGPMSNFITRNAMDAELIESGWWSGNEAYQKPAYYSFTYPQPTGIEKARIKPDIGRFDTTMGEFLLDYDVLRKAKNPADDLFEFLQSTYEAGAKLSGWDRKLTASGKPINSY